MLLIPAIDLKDGKCVRLRQGDMNDATTFDEDPTAMAQRWVEASARRLHLVDLNGAFAGKPVNEPAIRAILAEVGDEIPVQLGGGIRDRARIESWLEAGVRRVVLGTAAIANPDLVREAARAHPGRIVVGIDARKGKVAVDGWTRATETTARELADALAGAGVAAIVYTDIDRDGVLGGPNIEATVALAKGLPVPVIASGGVSTIDDITALRAHEKDGIAGVIVGRAIYDGRVDLKRALALAA